jgi:hypothetical protein
LSGPLSVGGRANPYLAPHGFMELLSPSAGTSELGDEHAYERGLLDSPDTRTTSPNSFPASAPRASILGGCRDRSGNESHGFCAEPFSPFRFSALKYRGTAAPRAKLRSPRKATPGRERSLLRGSGTSGLVFQVVGLRCRKSHPPFADQIVLGE